MLGKAFGITIPPLELPLMLKGLSTGIPELNAEGITGGGMLGKKLFPSLPDPAWSGGDSWERGVSPRER